MTTYIELFAEGVREFRHNNYKTALDVFGKVSAFYELNDENNYILVECYDYMATIYKENNSLNNALEYFSKALFRRQKEAKKDLKYAQNLSNLGEVYYELGEYDNAFQCHNEEVSLKEDLAKESLELAHSYNNLGKAHFAKGNIEHIEHAKILFDRSLNILTRKEAKPETEKILATSYHYIGLYYLIQGNNNAAIKELTKAIKIRERQMPDSLDLASSHHFLAVVHEKIGEVEDALIQYSSAHQIIENHRNHNPYDLIISYLNIGLAYHKLGNEGNAFSCYEIAHNLKCEYSTGSNLSKLRVSYSSYKDKLQTVLGLYETNFVEQEDCLGYDHPDLLFLAYDTALKLYKIKEYNESSKYLDEILARDAKYKYAYDLKGLINIEKGNFVQAKGNLEAALKIDQSYADAIIHHLEVLIAIVENTRLSNVERISCYNEIVGKISKSDKIPETGFDNEDQNKSDQREQTVNLKLPETEYVLGAFSYRKKLHDFKCWVESEQQRLSEQNESFTSEDRNYRASVGEDIGDMDASFSQLTLDQRTKSWCSEIFPCFF